MTSRAKAWQLVLKRDLLVGESEVHDLQLRSRLTGRSIGKADASVQSNCPPLWSAAHAPPARPARLPPAGRVRLRREVEPRHGTGKPALGAQGHRTQAAQGLGFPAFATKNTTRVGGADPVADAAAVAQAVFPGDRRRVAARGRDAGRHARLAARRRGRACLASPCARRSCSPTATCSRRRPSALDGARPRGLASAAGGAQVIRVGDVAAPGGLQAQHVAGSDPFALAAARSTPSQTRAARQAPTGHRRRPPTSPPFADARRRLGGQVRRPGALRHKDGAAARPRRAPGAPAARTIYVLGPPVGDPEGVVTQLRELGTVTRISGPDPVHNAIAFARYSDGAFGWGVVDPGHGLVFANAASARSTPPPPRRCRRAGTYGPLLLVGNADRSPSRRRLPARHPARLRRRTRCAASTITAGSSATSSAISIAVAVADRRACWRSARRRRTPAA